MLLPLAVELGFAIEPCAAWTQEMSDLRDARLKKYDQDPAIAAKRAGTSAVTGGRGPSCRPADRRDDPQVIHSALYDQRTKRSLCSDEYQNDWIGPGGWTNINKAHYRLIDKALQRHRGQRVVITFGAGPSTGSWSERGRVLDIRLLDVVPLLPAAENSLVPAIKRDAGARPIPA